MKNPGFTLLECLICLTILAITLCFAFPLTHTWYQQKQIDALEYQFKQALTYAKTQATLRGTMVCLTHLPGLDNWAKGMRLIEQTTTPKTLYEWRWSFSAISVVWHGFQSHDAICFHADVQHQAANGSLLVLSQHGVVKTWVINRLGTLRVEKTLA